MSRAEILRRFEEWLDGAVDSEEPPRGIEAEILAAVTGGATEGREPLADYSLVSGMTALTQEVRLQGRSFKDLNETLSTQANRMTDRERELLVRETERRCRKEALSVLIDLRDRLGRGLDSVRAGELARAREPVRVQEPIGDGEAAISKAAPRGWLARIFSPPELSRSDLSRKEQSLASQPTRDQAKTDQTKTDQAKTDQAKTDQARPDGDGTGATLAAFKKGYELGLDRLDQALEEFNAREIPSQGQPFDPRRMNAIDREESSALPEGTVLEVYRSGYEWNGELFRPAQVKVACAPAGKENE